MNRPRTHRNSHHLYHGPRLHPKRPAKPDRPPIRTLKGKEAACLEREATELADNLDGAARDAEDVRLGAELEPGGIGLFPVPAARIGITMIAEEQARR